MRPTLKVQLLSLCVLLGTLSTAAQSGFAQADPPLNFGNNFFVTGDYVVAGAQGMTSHLANGFATGTFSIPDANPGIRGTTTVPKGANIIAALLYWQTVEKVGAPGSGQNGFFGPIVNKIPQLYAISGVSLPSHSTVSFSSGGCSGGSTGKIVSTYRADVRAFMPVDVNGNVLVDSADGVTFEVRLPSVGTQTPLTLGATLVLIYRVLSPSVPLNVITIYDGAFAPSATTTLTMSQPIQGFYQAANSPVWKLTHIVGSGQSNKFETAYLSGGQRSAEALPSPYGAGQPAFPGWYGTWDNTTWVFPDSIYPPPFVNPLQENDDSANASVVPSPSQQGCVSWGAVILSTTVRDDSKDGILPVWKNNKGYTDVATGQFVSLDDPLDEPNTSQQDIFIQMDHVVDANGDFTPDPTAVKMVKEAFLVHNVHLHFTDASQTTGIAGANVINETACADQPLASPPYYCPYPNQIGITSWRYGFEFVKDQPLNYANETDCENATSPPCVRRFPIAQRNSHHYVVFGDTLGAANWTFLGGILTNSTGTTAPGSGIVSQVNNTVKFYTSKGHGLTVDNANHTLANGRVTVSNAITNPSLNGTFFVTSVSCPTNPDTGVPHDCSVTNKAAGPYIFTISIGGSMVTKNYTVKTDPGLAVASGQAGQGSGLSDVGGMGTLVTLGKWGADATVSAKAGTLMHELGHTLGLTLHGGSYYDGLAPGQAIPDYRPTIEANCKSNYQSVMNYMFQTRLLGTTGVVDYSSQQLSNLDETSLGPITDSSAIAFPTTDWYDTKETFAAFTIAIAASPTGATESGSVVTITTPSPHGLVVGEQVIISGVGVSGYNGTFNIVSVANPTQFTYDTSPGLAPSGGGTASAFAIAIANPNGATESGSVVTITTTSAHGLIAGQSVTITGVGVSGYNGTFTVASVPDSTHFTYNAVPQLTPSGGGSVKKPIGTAATHHCDDTPLNSTDPPTYFYQGGSLVGPDELEIPWSSTTLDANFEGNMPGSEHPFRGYNDWTPTFNTANGLIISPAVDPRQVGATGSSLLGPGGLFSGPGGLFSGPGGLFSGPGGLFSGPGGLFSGPGGLFSGPGGLFSGPGGLFGGPGELDFRNALSVTPAPASLMASEAVSPRTITLTWTEPNFPATDHNNVYRSADGVNFTLIASVPGTAPGTQNTFADNVTCNLNGYSYFVTTVVLNTSVTPPQPQESTPSNTVSVGQSSERLTGCYTVTGFSSTAAAVQGSPATVTWTLTDASNTAGAAVSRTTANTLVVTGPLPGNCASSGHTTLLADGLVSNAGTVDNGSTDVFTPNGDNFTFTWNRTDAFCAGSYTFELDLDHVNGAPAQTQMAANGLQLSIDINDQDTPHVTTLALPAGTVAVSYNPMPLTEDGGVGALTWNVTGLPTGISQQPAGSPTLSGTACFAGQYPVSAIVTDSASPKHNSGSQAFTLQINPGASTTGVTSNVNSSVFQQPVTFTVTVASTPVSSCTPGGTVTLLDGGSAIASNLPLSGGTATFMTSALSVGVHSITASYSGDGNFSPSNSNSSPYSQTVNKASTQISSVSVSPSPVYVNQSVSVSYAVSVVAPGGSSPIAPTGNITVMASDGSTCSVALPAPCILSPPAATAGNVTFTITYAGDGNFLGSGPAASGYTVQPAPTQIAFNSISPSTLFVGQPITVFYTFSVVVPGTGSPTVPTGNISVTASDGSSCVAMPTLGGGMCTLSPVPTAAGNVTFAINYPGDHNFVASGYNGNYNVYKLVFTTQPSNTGVGNTIAPAVQVTAEDSTGATLTAFGGGITVAKGSGPGTLSGTLTQNAVAGVATFPDLSINKVATGDTLVASPAGGVPAATSNAFNITLALNYTQLQPTTTPGLRCCGAMAYDPISMSTLLFGGTQTFDNISYSIMNDTWQLKNGQWTQLSPVTSPPARSGAAMVYDAAHNNIVLFGGTTGSSDLNDTWIWNGSTWSATTPLATPPGRRFDSQGMAYDPNMQAVVMFGGIDHTSTIFYNDTWVWNGTTWTQMNPTSSPSARRTVLATDPSGNVMLFGGGGPSGALADTWVWGGTNWNQQSPATSPAARDLHNMAFNPNVGAVVLFAGGGGLNDVWSWDGTTWTQVTPAAAAPQRYAFGMDYDGAANAIFVFGGFTNNGPAINDTWEFTVSP